MAGVVIVNCHGGLVQNVLSDDGITVIVIDHDEIRDTEPDDAEAYAADMLGQLAATGGDLAATAASWVRASLAERGLTIGEPDGAGLSAAPSAPGPSNRRPVRAHFRPQAWVNDNAIDVDPEGDDEWDATDGFWNVPSPYRDDLIAEMDRNGGEAIDSFDYFKHDRHAPAWVRDYRGPFTITVRFDD